MSIFCASTIDHLASFQFRVARRDKPEARALQQHLQSCPNLFSVFLTTLLKKLIFNQVDSYWSLSRPVLSIILAHEQAFAEAKQHLLNSQPQQHHQKMTEEFDKLLIKIDRNLEATNRDRFTQRVTALRNALKSFVVMPNAQ